MDFRHTAEARRNYDATLAIEQTPAGVRADPQVGHFAYRDAGVRRMAWRPYGFVKALGSTLRLCNFSGRVDVTERPEAARVVFVEAWFGEGAEFRVASLHKFTLRIQPGSPSGAGRVRFALPSGQDSRP